MCVDVAVAKAELTSLQEAGEQWEMWVKVCQ